MIQIYEFASKTEPHQNEKQENNELLQQRREAIQKLTALSWCQPKKNCLPEANTLIDMKTGNVFAEPGT